MDKQGVNSASIVGRVVHSSDCPLSEVPLYMNVRSK